MKKMFKNIFLAALSLAIPAMVHAFEPTYGKLGVELLYFKPSIDESSYVVSSSFNAVGDEFFPNGTRHLNASNYKPAFRITASTPLCGIWNDLEVRFTHLCANQSDSTTGPFLFDTIGYAGEGAQAPEDTSYNGTARIKDIYRYSSADMTFGRFPLESCGENLELLVGLHSAYIFHRTQGRSVGVSGTAPVNNALNSQSQFWGIGPELGLEYLYDPSICRNFGLTGSVRGALLCSDSNANINYVSLRTVGTAGPRLKNQHLWRVTPTFDAKLGGIYEFQCSCFNSSIEIGYEWIWYHNAVDSIRSTEVAFPGYSYDEYSDFSLQGPYLRLCVDF